MIVAGTTGSDDLLEFLRAHWNGFLNHELWFQIVLHAAWSFALFEFSSLLMLFVVMILAASDGFLCLLASLALVSHRDLSGVNVFRRDCHTVHWTCASVVSSLVLWTTFDTRLLNFASATHLECTWDSDVLNSRLLPLNLLHNWPTSFELRKVDVGRVLLEASLYLVKFFLFLLSESFLVKFLSVEFVRPWARPSLQLVLPVFVTDRHSELLYLKGLSANRLRRKLLFWLASTIVINNDTVLCGFQTPSSQIVINSVLTLNWVSTRLSIDDTCRCIVFFARSRLGRGRDTFLLLATLNLRHVVSLWDESKTRPSRILDIGGLCIIRERNCVHLFFLKHLLLDDVTLMLLYRTVDLVLAELTQTDDWLMLLLLLIISFACGSLPSFHCLLALTHEFLRGFVNYLLIGLVQSRFWLVWTLLPVRLASRWIATWPVLLVGPMVEVQHRELRLIECSIGGYLRVVHVLDLDDGSLATLPPMCEHFC